MYNPPVPRRALLARAATLVALVALGDACKHDAPLALAGDAGAREAPDTPRGHVEVGATAVTPPAPKYTATDGGGYEVRFPYPDVKPDLATQPIVGGVEHVAKVNGRYGTFLVGWDDTLKMVGGRASSRVFDDIVNRTVKTNSGKKLSDHTITLPIPFGAPHPKGRTSWDGREIEATFVAKDKSHASAHWRLYLVGSRVYQLLSLAPEGREVPPEVLRDFFDSFALQVPDSSVHSLAPSPSALPSRISTGQ